MVDTYPMSVPASEVKRLVDYINVVEHAGSYTSTLSGEEIERLLSIVQNMEYSMPVGVEWDTSSNSPSLRRIDINGNTINPSTAFFDKHQIWGGMWTCVRDRTTGKFTFGTNPRGDGLTLDGTVGDVLVRIPIADTLYVAEGNFRKFIEIPHIPNNTRYKIDPAGVQRGGVERPFIYVGAKEAYGYLDGSTFKLGSAAGKQPITGEVAYTDLPNSGRLTMDDAEDYANNIGAGFGITNIHTLSYLARLMIIEYGTFNLQAISELGAGVSYMESGTGFAGKMTGADSIDLPVNTAPNGTGKGESTEGATPMKWRGIENIIGNAAEYIIGVNSSNADNTYKILSRCGTQSATLSATLAAGTYETGASAIPVSSSSYIKTLQTDELGALTFMPLTVGGTESTYLCDVFSSSSNAVGLCTCGGAWNGAAGNGINNRSFGATATFSSVKAGCRIEYIPQA